MIAHSNKHSIHMGWRVVANANQEVCLGYGLGVARGGLLVDLCWFFFFFWLGQVHFNSFHAVGTCTCLFMQDQQFKEWYDFHIFFLSFFFSKKQGKSLSSSPDSSPCTSRLLRVLKEPQGAPHLYPLSVKPWFAYRAPHLGPTETVGQSQLGWAREVDSKSEERLWKWAIPGRNMEMGCNCTEKRRAFVKRA